MKFFMVSLLFALLAACALAVDAPKKSVLISSESEDVIKQAIDEVKAAKGVILHEYKLIHAFLASAPAKVFQELKADFETQNKGHLVIEEDQDVNIWNDDGN